MLGIERQPVLQALQRVDEERAEGIEHEQRDGVELPAHFRAGIDAAEAVDQGLEPRARAQRARSGGLP